MMSLSKVWTFVTHPSSSGPTAGLLPRSAAGVWSTSTIRTRRQMRPPWCSPQRTTATCRSETPLRTMFPPLAAWSQTTTTIPLPPPPPPQHRCPRLITARWVRGSCSFTLKNVCKYCWQPVCLGKIVQRRVLFTEVSALTGSPDTRGYRTRLLILTAADITCVF